MDWKKGIDINNRCFEVHYTFNNEILKAAGGEKKTGDPVTCVKFKKGLQFIRELIVPNW